MPTIYETAKAFRRELLRRDAQLAGQLLAAYGSAYSRIRAALDDLLEEMNAARESGEVITAAWLARRNRLETLQNQIAIEITRFSDYADRSILNGQTQAVRDAEIHALELMRLGAQASRVVESGVLFDRAPIAALQELVGFLSDGSPLRDIFSMNGAFAAHAAEEAMISGLAMGKNSRAIAKELAEALEITKTRARTIARTEILRAYRGAATHTMKANQDYVRGYIRIASLSIRTCSLCWALHGSFHELDEEFATHPNCRCTQIPAIRGSTLKIEAGPAAFSKLDEEKQLEILGAKKFALYRDGVIDLPDLVAQSPSSKWGAGIRERTLAELTDSAA